MEKGFSVIEVIVASAIFVFLGSAAAVGTIQGLTTNRLGAEFSVASNFASEGIEAVKSIKNRGFSNLADTPGCGLTTIKITGQDVWTFPTDCTATPNNTLTHNSQDNYIRVIKVESVYRDSTPPAGNIVDQSTPGSVIDLKTKKVTSTVSWNFTSSRPESVFLVTYLSDWSEAIAGLTPPTVTTSPANPVANTTATLNGQANPNGKATLGWFRYDTTDPGACNDTFGTRIPASLGQDLGSGTALVDYSENITGLSPGITYYFCAIASNSDGAGLGAISNFITGAPPTVTTNDPSGVTSSGATLNGSADPNGKATLGWFRYDTTSPGTCNDTFGTKVPGLGQDLGSGTAPVGYFENITGLSASTTYYYCAVASNADGTGYGQVIKEFSTLPAPQIQFINSTANSGNNPTSGSFTLPAGWAAGDVAVFWWYTYNNIKTIIPPGTIIQKQNASSSGFGRLYIGYRVLQSGDSSFAWTSGTEGGSTTGSTTVWGTSVFRNVNTTGDPFEAQSGAPSTFVDSLNPNPPSATTLSPNAMVVPIYGKRDDYTTITPPSGYTSAGSSSSTAGSDASAAAASFLKSATGIEDPGVWTLTGGATTSSDGYVWTGVLKP